MEQNSNQEKCTKPSSTEKSVGKRVKISYSRMSFSSMLINSKKIDIILFFIRVNTEYS